MTGRIYQLQYQALAEPLPDIVLEVVTVDKWFSNTSLPTRNWTFGKLFSVAAITFSLFFTNLGEAEATTPDKWQPITNVPLFDIVRQQHIYPTWAVGIFEEEPAEEVSVDSWYQNTNTPRFDKQRTQYPYPPFSVDTLQLTQSENITVDKWYVITERPRWDRKRWQGLYPTFAVGVFEEEPAEEVSVDSWYQNTNIPRFDRPRRQWLYPSEDIGLILPISAITPEGPLVIVFKKVRYQYQSLAQPLPDRFGSFASGPQDLTLTPLMLGTTELRTNMSSKEYNALVSALELQPTISTDQVVS